MVEVPVLAIDGPSGAGKGTVAAILAERLGWRILDSGALYRLTALLALQEGTPLDDENVLAAQVVDMQVEFKNGRAWLNSEDVESELRTESTGNAASQVAALPAVRQALLDWQRNYAKPPGLVADGRDMGSVVFPKARLKVFLTASAEERAIRRHKQLSEKGIDAKIEDLTKMIAERDERDRSRATAPLIAAPDALEIDSTHLSIEQVVEIVLKQAESAFNL